MQDEVVSFILQVVSVMREDALIGVLLYSLITSAMCLLFFPAWILAALAGYLYGPLLGTVLLSPLGAAIASIAFFISRNLMRPMAHKRLSANEYFRAIESSISTKGFLIIFLLRLSSVLPFAPLSYMLGVSNVRFREFFWASWVGMLPGTLMYVYIGSLAADVRQILAKEHDVARIFPVLGIAVLLIAVLLIAKSAKKNLDKIIKES